MNKARFEAFADSVFAFAITLLALGFVLPLAGTSHATDAWLTGELLTMWPNLIAYVLSFAVIGIMWQNHHALFRLVQTVDRRTVFNNLLLLGATVLIPFATSTLGAYPHLHAAAFLYGVIMTLCATAYNVMLRHLVATRAFRPDVSDATIRQTVVAYRVGWCTYGVATLVALVAPLVSFGLYLAIALYYLIPRGVDTDLEHT